MKIALVGNQNSGKSTLFNSLTGLNQKIGNWPGVTVEKKSGILKGTNFEIVDLPGIYSLSPYTKEEEVSRNFLLQENPDLVINILDATNIERSLYLTTQLLELDCNLVVALNMCDLLEKKGLKINEAKLSTELGVSVFKISALKNSGIETLINYVKKQNFKKEPKKIFEPKIEQFLSKNTRLINTEHKRFVCVKLLERDYKLPNLTDKSTNLEPQIKEIENYYNLDTEQIIANQRYNYIVKIKEKCVIKSHSTQSITDKLDKLFLNKFLAIPIFAVIMGLVYFLSVGFVGAYTINLINNGIDFLNNQTQTLLTNIGASPWAISLVCDGVISGVGAVLNFVPQLIMLFICIAVLETTGYMSRISFFFDKMFRYFGLSGKSLIPFIVGSGCSVPAIMTTRTIEDEHEKQATIMLTPFIPCSAKLPIITMFAGYFFKNSWLVMVSLYIFAIIIIILSAVVLRKFFLKSSSTSYISELPEYKLPSFKYVANDVIEKTFSFLKRAGTTIFMCSIIVWFLLKFNWKLEFGIDVENSIMATIGNSLAWIFYPILGTHSWAATVSAIQGLVAKEQVVSSMGVIAHVTGTTGAEIFGSGIFGFFTPISAYAFIVFNLFSAPCFGAISAMRHELGSTKKTMVAVLFQIGVAWLIATAINLIGSILVWFQKF